MVCPQLILKDLPLFEWSMSLGAVPWLVAGLAAVGLNRPSVSQLTLEEVGLLRHEISRLRLLVEQLEAGCTECWWQNWVLLWLNRGLLVGLLFLVITLCLGFWKSFSLWPRKRVRSNPQVTDLGAESDSDRSPSTLASTTTVSRRSGPFRPSDRLKLQNGGT